MLGVRVGHGQVVPRVPTGFRDLEPGIAGTRRGRPGISQMGQETSGSGEGSSCEVGVGLIVREEARRELTKRRRREQLSRRGLGSHQHRRVGYGAQWQREGGVVEAGHLRRKDNARGHHQGSITECGWVQLLIQVEDQISCGQGWRSGISTGGYEVISREVAI